MAKKEVKNAFGAVANEYQKKANVQRRVAGQLAERISGFDLPEKPRILEIGCGTGFLSQHLLKRWPDATIVCSDIAPQMVSSCKANLYGFDKSRVSFVVMDGENITGDDKYDLIVSSLVFQWFSDPLANLVKLTSRLNHNGRLAFVTLGEETFNEWRGFCAEYQIACGLHNYPTKDAWQSSWPIDGVGEVDVARVMEEHPSPQNFLRGLKQIGTGLSKKGHSPVSIVELRRALSEYSNKNNSFSITYHLIFGSFIKN
ncbi:MAG: methyltransferase domain-containing protein [Magnetococcales bacterium]|nr:methyltransferase domain-containing protein [Magnetococcales bacterium]